MLLFNQLKEERGRHILSGNEDAALIARIRAGDVDAFEALVAEYEPRLVRFIYGMTRERELAEDLVQDTFLSAYRALATAPDDLKLSAWLYKIALNKLRSEKRRKRPLSLFALPSFGAEPARPEDEQPILNLPDPRAEPGEQVAERQQIVDILDRLPEDQATALVMDAQGYNDEEIAATLEVSVGAVRQKLFRGRKAFRALYQ